MSISSKSLSAPEAGGVPNNFIFSIARIDGEMRGVIYTAQQSSNNENNRALVPTQLLAHAAGVASTGKDDILARDTTHGLSL